MKEGVATWKSSVLDPWKVHSACTKGACGMKLIAISYIQELRTYNAWQLHTIHVQKGHGHVQLLLGSILFHQAGDTPYSYVSNLIYSRYI